MTAFKSIPFLLILCLQLNVHAAGEPTPTPAPKPAPKPVSKPAQTPAQTPAQPQGFQPFAYDAKAAARAPRIPGITPFQLPLGIGAKNASKWVVGGISIPEGEKAFAMEQVDGKDVLRLFPKAFDAGQTLLGYRLPPLDAKNVPNYISFLCKSTKETNQITVNLLPTSVIMAGGLKVVVPVNPGEWQRVIIPFSQFGLKSAPRVQAIGIGIASAAKNSDVLVSDITIGATAQTPETLSAKRTIISLKGEWRFATDAGDVGLKEKWNAPEFDDTAWKTLKANSGWSDQGVVHAGWAWYRQKLIVPKESEGAPLTLALAEIPFEDEVYFNGVRIGGLGGGYMYQNFYLRTYTVPDSLVHYGEANTIAVRTWGVNGGAYVSSKSGLVMGNNPKITTYYQAELDPYAVKLRSAATKNEEVSPDHFDISSAQQKAPFEVVFRFPGDALKDSSGTLHYTLMDFYNQVIQSGHVPVTADKNGLVKAVVAVDAETSEVVYLRGRFKAFLTVCDASGVPVCTDAREVDRLSLAARDTKSLPALPETLEETPYGKLKLVDEIDCTVPADKEEHPYMQSALDHAQDAKTPGAPLKVNITEILGKKAREIEEGVMGCFAYRIGRGKLQPHKNYLLRVEYPEDKPRYIPFEIQNGHNFMDVGCKLGVSATDPYDNWPLSKTWQWYDSIVSLDEETTGGFGTGSASAEHGFWVYFINKKKAGRYTIQYAGGPAVARMKLYEIDPEKNAPAITKPKGLPQRVLSVDWERQADQPPEDIVRYCKLMGYNAVSPIMLKWTFMNYGEPLSGYETVILDGHRYWVKSAATTEDDPKPTEETAAATEAAGEDTADSPGTDTAGPDAKPKQGGAPTTKAAQPATAKPSVHLQYLAMTKKWGINYIPRIEYGGSQELRVDAWVIAGDGEVCKPTRFSTWGADLLHPATWEDLKRTVASYFKPYAKDNPQLTGMLWRMRCDRMEVSYSRRDIEMFCKETNTKLPDLPAKELAGWASSGEMGERYADWWQQKRAEFHAKLVALLKSYRPDMMLYLYNWDEDKFSMGPLDMFSSGTFIEFARARFGMAPQVYEKHVRDQQKLTGEDYVRMIRTGHMFNLPIESPAYALHMELYKDLKGMQVLAPVNALYSADCPAFINYFKTADGVSVSNPVTYDEIGRRSINPKYEGSMLTPGGPAFSMALELLSYFHGDARMLTYTVYTYGRGFADAHRRFAQAFLALPAIPGTEVDQGDKDLKVRAYPSPNGTYVGVAYKGYTGKKLAIKVPGTKAGAKVRDLVTGQIIPTTMNGGGLQFDLASGPMELNAFLVE